MYPAKMSCVAKEMRERGSKPVFQTARCYMVLRKTKDHLALKHGATRKTKRMVHGASCRFRKRDDKGWRFLSLCITGGRAGGRAAIGASGSQITDWPANRLRNPTGGCNTVCELNEHKNVREPCQSSRQSHT